VLDVAAAAGEQIVDGKDFMSVRNQPVAQMHPRNPAPPVTKRAFRKLRSPLRALYGNEGG
jgi:hypothetical protein